jgi:hypothetical protein
MELHRRARHAVSRPHGTKVTEGVSSPKPNDQMSTVLPGDSRGRKELGERMDGSHHGDEQQQDGDFVIISKVDRASLDMTKGDISTLNNLGRQIRDQGFPVRCCVLIPRDLTPL